MTWIHLCRPFPSCQRKVYRLNPFLFRHLDRIEDLLQDEDDETESKDLCLSEEPQDLTSLNAEDFAEFLDEIGWSKDGMFVTLLSTMDYYFCERDGRLVASRRGSLPAHFRAVSCFCPILGILALP